MSNHRVVDTFLECHNALEDCSVCYIPLPRARVYLPWFILILRLLWYDFFVPPIDTTLVCPLSCDSLLDMNHFMCECNQIVPFTESTM